MKRLDENLKVPYNWLSITGILSPCRQSPPFIDHGGNPRWQRPAAPESLENCEPSWNRRRHFPPPLRYQFCSMGGNNEEIRQQTYTSCVVRLFQVDLIWTKKLKMPTHNCNHLHSQHLRDAISQSYWAKKNPWGIILDGVRDHPCPKMFETAASALVPRWMVKPSMFAESSLTWNWISLVNCAKGRPHCIVGRCLTTVNINAPKQHLIFSLSQDLESFNKKGPR